MEINRDNYELYFLLYTDNELDSTEQKAVESFADLHADLKEELKALLQTRLSVHEDFSYVQKESLFQIPNTVSAIDGDNYEEYFVLYTDGELKADEREMVENFIEQHPQKLAELQLLQQVKIHPDNITVFPDKAVLYKPKKSAGLVITLQWQRIVAAAAIIAIGSWLWMNTHRIISHQTIKPVSSVDSMSLEQSAGQQKMAGDHLLSDIKEHIGRGLAEMNTGETPNLHLKQNNKMPVNTNQSVPAIYNSATIRIAQIQNTDTSGVLEQASGLYVKDPELLAVTSPVTESAEVKSNDIPDSGDLKPLIRNQLVSHQNNDNIEPFTEDDQEFAYLNTDQVEKKSNKKLRGLIRKASRYVNQITNPDIEDDRAIVRVAVFEIARKN